MHDTDLSYFTMREQQERNASRQATDPAVKDIHFGMAERYADTVWSIREGLRPSDAPGFAA
jgi:hypothetical protein